MPNWCDNTVYITHDDPKKIQVLVDAWKENKFFEPQLTKRRPIRQCFRNCFVETDATSGHCNRRRK